MLETTIASTAVIHPLVQLGQGVTIEDFCIIGVPFKGGDRQPTLIGDRAVIRSHTVIYAGNRIGDDFQTGHKVNIRELNDIGDDVSIGTLSTIEHHLKIGDRVRIHSQAFLPEYAILEADVWIGPHAVLTNAKFPRHPDAKAELRGPYLEESARIGANVTVLPGVRIGARSLIGAGSVVTTDIPPGIIAIGNPARYLRDVHY